MASVSAFIIALYLAVLVVALISRGRDFTHPWLFLLRGFFPSWRFFDAPGPQPRLFVRMLSEDERLEATAVQTVGEKGWDGFVLAIVKTQ